MSPVRLPGLDNDIVCSLEEAVAVFIFNSCRLHCRNATATNLHLYSCGVQTILKLYISAIFVSSLTLNVCSAQLQYLHHSSFCCSSKLGLWLSLDLYRHLSFLLGEWIVFLSGGSEEAPGAGRKQQLDRTTKPTPQDEHSVLLCRPLAPTGVHAAL